MDEGFPGKLEVKSEYVINYGEDIIGLEYNGRVLDGKMSHINMTNHTYWNLSGDFKEPTIR
jgi:galactose mutarotase-like enzyme